ncbi:D-alanyl-D-alanine carboxypeptidase family protein [Faecalicatena contorta]|uniref:D-alanyl-D-alanine carboxypeptidase n=1 Tax=Faecalicatena contorta TaxID=39482 RepID=A0A315ZL79_9FIRM|nr:D-alanyl-D-alanine carboxypeptidase family protein [Faecalicatena contorta]PWJ46301.1 D-alanyl-D-alanine carboxypeptidase [Faecalicatena contorta]SUQ16419.1 D-alanyl-D-alanine carboxypeptidase [Faecalicatena contorta]
MKAKRILFCIIMTALLVLRPAVVFAEDGDAQEKTEEELVAEEEKEKADSYAADIDTNGLENWPQGPSVYAGSAVVMDMESGAVLFGKNTDVQHYPASITKLLTTLVALENGKLTDKVKFTDDSISFLQYDDAQIGMKSGEELNLEDALYAVLLASANEVSYAVAESVGEQSLGGNYDTFIQKMNERAIELGCTNSHWVNANGLHDDQHYTTAHDMALIASKVYQQEEFRKIMGILEYKIGPTNLTQEERVFQQNHRMLWPENYYYCEYCKGGKTGYTDQAKTTLVTMADNGKMHLAAVVLYDYGVDAYTDTKSMLDYVFNNFTKVPVKDKETSEDIKQFINSQAYVVLPKGVEFSQLEKNIILTEDGIRNGKIIYTYKEQNVGSADIVLTEEGYQKLTGGTAPADTQNLDLKQENSTQPIPEKSTENTKLKLYIAIGSVAVFLALMGGLVYTRTKR